VRDERDNSVPLPRIIMPANSDERATATSNKTDTSALVVNTLFLSVLFSGSFHAISPGNASCADASDSVEDN